MPQFLSRISSSFPIVAIVFAAATLSASALAQRGGGAPRAALVEVNPVREEPVSGTVAVVGRVVPREHGAVAATAPGPVAEVRVRVGDRVEAGGELMVLARDMPQADLAEKRADEALAQARVQTAEAELELVRQELARLEQLRGSSAFPKAAYDDKSQELVRARSRVRETSAALERASAQRRMSEIELDRTIVRAPWPGVVTARHISPGDFARAGDPVVTLVDDRHLELEADVASDRIGGLTPGLEVDFELEDGSSHRAAVRAVVPDENPLTRTRPVRFIPRFPDGSAPAANQSVVLQIPIGAPRTVASVHKDAIINRGGEALVYVVEGPPDAARAASRPIQIGEAVGNRFIVLDGLSAGDLVVVRGNERINPGQAIRFNPQSDTGAGS